MDQELNEYQVYLLLQLDQYRLEHKKILPWKRAWLKKHREATYDNLTNWEEQLVKLRYISREKPYDSGRFTPYLEQHQIIERMRFMIEQRAIEYLDELPPDKKAINLISLNQLLASKKVIVASEYKENKQGKITNKPLSIAESAIMQYYLHRHNERPITENNKNEIAAEYGYEKKTSGKQLLDEYRLYNNGIQNVADKTQLKRLTNILPVLEEKHQEAAGDVKKDMDRLKKKIQR
ncbi:MAG: hypothetical protein K9G49_12550 [Taibaiella sp.]|nr:hypothetical protein [Taibaiella sp.]